MVVKEEEILPAWDRELVVRVMVYWFDLPLTLTMLLGSWGDSSHSRVRGEDHVVGYV